MVKKNSSGIVETSNDGLNRVNKRNQSLIKFIDPVPDQPDHRSIRSWQRRGCAARCSQPLSMLLILREYKRSAEEVL